MKYSIEMHKSSSLTRDEVNQRLYNAFTYLTELSCENEKTASSDDPGREAPLPADATAPEGAAQETVYTESGEIESNR